MPPVKTPSSHLAGWCGHGTPSSHACSSVRCPSRPSGARCPSYAAWEFQRSRFCGTKRTAMFEEQTQQILSEVQKCVVNIIRQLFNKHFLGTELMFKLLPELFCTISAKITSGLILHCRNAPSLSSLSISAPDMAEMLLKIHEKFAFSIKRTNPPTRPESQRV